MKRISAFKAIRAHISLLVLLSLVHPSRVFAANPDLETVLTGSRQRIEKLDYRLTGRLTRVEGNEMRDLGAWLREDPPSSANEREWARDHRENTSG
jgi:hypothetical protein